MVNMEKYKNILSIPKLLDAIKKDQDEVEYSVHYNMLICMFAAPLLFAGALCNLFMSISLFDVSIRMILFDSAALLVLSAAFEIFQRSNLKYLPHAVHIISVLFAIAFLFVAFRFYDAMGPSVWVLGIIMIIFSLGQNTKVMFNYLITAMIASGFYIEIWTQTQEHAFYNISLFGFFVLSLLVASTVYKITDARKQMISVQNQEIKNQVEERKRAEEANIRLSLYDHLTGLPNRMLFNDRLNQAMLYAKRNSLNLYVLFIDLDNFKLINDTMGHSMGDELLKKVGERLSGSLRKSDVIARIGGDEFLVLLQDIGSDQDAAKVVSNIVTGVCKPFSVGVQLFSVTCSVGVSKFPSEGEDVDTLVKCADLAMYKAKEIGKNCFAFYSESLKSNLLKELNMVNELQQALQNNEFVLHYQPQINSTTREIIGIEALIRWNHPKNGLMSPYQFMPIAEKSGFIVQIGEWVLRTACLQNKAWQDEGFITAPIAVNIADKQILSKSLVNKLSEILQETKLAPEYLELEISERLLISDIERIKTELEYIRNLGVKIAIDDFCMGYTSMINIKKLPIDVIKIPLEFVQGIDKNIKDESIISVILGLAETLAIDVIAEGVETAKQLEFLNDRACSNVQGYYFYKPMDAEALKTTYSF